MNCKCDAVNQLLATIILVWTIWPGLIGLSSYWVVLVSAVLILVHAFGCHGNKGCCDVKKAPASKNKTAKKRKK